MNKIFVFFITAAIISVAICGCSPAGENTGATQAPSSATQSVTQPLITAPPATQSPTQAPTQPATTFQSNSEPGTFEADTVYTATEYAPPDETETAATTSPTAASSSAADITSTNYFAGVWQPVAAFTVASNKQVSFTDAFGSSYSTYGGSFTVYEENYFEVGMGSYNEEHSHQGYFTVSGTKLNATYDDGIKDTFDYVANYNGKEAVKVKIGEFYVYFSR